MRWWLLLVAGCYHANGFAPCETRCDDGLCPDNQICGGDLFCHGPTDGLCTERDAGIDGPADAPPDAPYPCPAKYFDDFGAVCPPPTTATTTLDSDIYTDLDPHCALYAQHATGPHVPAVCLITGGNITISHSLHVYGTRTLAIVATGKITIADSATLDVGSTTALPGPGAGTDDCGTPSTADTTCIAHAGGSAGFEGGNGGTAQTPVGPGTKATPAVDPPVYLRGGCPSDRTGSATGGQQTYDGVGGGGLYLAARDQIEILGTITAGGAGGSAGLAKVGAGGGGAGGMIVLEAPDIVVVGFVSANGGGGASGKSTVDSVRGENSVSSTAAPGGQGNFQAVGGNGSTGMMGSVGGDYSACAGGGGGGAGFIYLIFRGTDMTGSQQFSPLPKQRVSPAD